MTVIIQSIVHDLHSTTSTEKTFFLRFSSNSEANASESQENLKAIYPHY